MLALAIVFNASAYLVFKLAVAYPLFAGMGMAAITLLSAVMFRERLTLSTLAAGHHPADPCVLSGRDEGRNSGGQAASASCFSCA